MYLTPGAKDLITKFAAKYPFPITNDEDSANWTHRLCEQLAFSYPATPWGHKKASDTRPHSADVIALSNPFVGWDIITNAGTPAARLNLNDSEIDLSGQVFEPVNPVNHLADAPPIEPPVIPPTIPPASNLDVEILNELKKHTMILTAIANAMATIPAQLQEALKAGVKIKF